MGAHQWIMAQIVQSQQPPRLTLEELRKIPGLEILSDEELDQLSASLMECSMILYSAFQTFSDLECVDHESKDLIDAISESD